MKKFILVILIFFVTGCWDQREARDLGIANSFLFDYKDGKIIFLAEIVNPKTQSSISPAPAGSVPYIYIKGEGNSILEATNNASITLDKYLYVAHIKSIFLTETFAKEVGLVPLLDLFSRYPELRQNEYMVIVKGENAESLYKSTVSLADYFGTFIENSKQTQNYRLSKTTYTKMLDVIKAYYCEMEEPVLGVIQKISTSENEENEDNPLTGEIIKDNTKVLYEGFAVFDKEKLVYIADGEETLMYNFIEGKAKAIDVVVKEITYKVMSAKPKISVEYNDKKVKINIDLALKLLVMLDEGKHDYTNLKTISKLEKEINDKLTKDLNEFIDNSQKNVGIDFFNFASYFHIKYPNVWEKIYKDWNNYFQNADISVKVKSTIQTEGKIKKSVKLVEEEDNNYGGK